mmetsp:Transcript_18413/g.29670  ORF Transcript_18413/g.29670 Transcript_18413/m.29670 type:complete len:165 (+) Transcript_18413:317-811(+)|eukprot:CAMPEP_0171488676 /NCGR_PEP_ID=MMETSP0958-20121227/2332_1 /TAXON_ID=87120 /ORGANISM="Aurantiochytrium limacinum, Strain ATCCMYA-1381" /LENGTH=164 /DNA_ID=CAMNT_0012021801 /DNA_START=265 /DNA_END=759 /DNA_ORIENTATION=-
MKTQAKWSSGSSLAVQTAAPSGFAMYEDATLHEEPSSNRSSGSSWSRPSSGSYLSKLKSARSFSIFSSSKRSNSPRESETGLEDVEHEHVETDDDFDEQDDIARDLPSNKSSSSKGRSTNLTAAERRSLTRKSAKRLGLTLDGKEVECANRRRSSFSRRASTYF